MVQIEVDSEVFGHLQQHARPLLDTPNDVLRRLLLGERADSVTASPTRGPMEQPVSTTLFRAPADVESFVQSLLRSNFSGTFRRRSPYRMMFESEADLVYFQNFNKESDHLWYRITDSPWKDLRSSGKAAWVAFTNPAEHFAFLVPVTDIEDRCQRAAWTRTYLEVNIDPATSRWTELDWDLSKYRKVLV